MAIPGMKSLSPPPLHAPMPSPVEEVAERHWWGFGRPLGLAAPNQAPSPPPSRGGLWARHGLLLAGFLSKWVELMGVFIVPLGKSASESAFQ